jgi:hypothetical protein
LNVALSVYEDFHVSFPGFIGVSAGFFGEGAFFEGYAVFAVEAGEFSLAI